MQKQEIFHKLEINFQKLEIHFRKFKIYFQNSKITIKSLINKQKCIF